MFNIKLSDLKELPISKILVVILAIVCIAAIRSCQMKTLEVTSSGVKIQMYENQTKQFVVKVNKLGETVSTQLAVISDKDKQVEKLLAQNSTLQYVSTQVKIGAKTTISDISIPYSNALNIIKQKDSISNIVSNSCDSSYCIPIGTEFNKVDKWYSISGSIQKNGIKFDSLSFNDSIIYNLGTKRKPGIKGFFKPYDPTIEVIGVNPYMKVRSLQNMTFVRPPKWYENRGVWLAAGFIGGTVGTYYLVHK